MKTKEVAQRRQDKLLARARAKYPEADGYYHDPASDGWPDLYVVVRVYKWKVDRRYKSGRRLVFVTELGPITTPVE